MNRKTRWLVGLTAMAFVAPARAADATTYFPAETDAVLSMNVRQVVDSPLVKTYALDAIKAALAGRTEVQAAIRAAGIDPLSDIDRITAGLSLRDVKNPDVVVVIAGKFDPKKLSGLLDARAKERPNEVGLEKVGGKAIYRLAVPEHSSAVYLASVDAGTLVVATKKEHAAAALETKQRPAIRKEVADLVKRADAKSSLYAVAVVKDRLGSVSLPDAQMKRIIEQVQHLTLDLRVEKDISLEVTLAAENAESAKQLQLIVGAVLDLARLQAKAVLAEQPDLQPLTDLVKSLKATQQDKRVVVTGGLSGEAVGKMLIKKGK